MINIKVAVRIRPFSDRELIQNDELIVEGEDKSIFVTNPKIPGKKDGDSRQRTKRFSVDFCYDAKNPHSSSQEAVYKEIGEEILNSTFGGYNSCVLAYGHSASGKTYTIMGLPDDPGLTPRICQGLFDRIDSKPNINFQIIVSFLEIYNEKVRDLLGKEDEEPFSRNLSLRVREHPKLGPYVQDLSQHIVDNKNRLLELLILGNTRRSTAATENNNHSSRSHAVFTLRIKQTDEETFETDKSSKVHLVDLAGSERANGVQNKTRLKEGANINKSLVTLGNVISALAESYEIPSNTKEHSTLKTWQPFVPYRDSVLTWLLKDTLGGNSNTIMIATVSPASSCLNETINTLRYAKRTKRILNQPIVNEDPKIRTIRELRKEIAKLKFMLLSFHKVSNLAGENSEFSNVSCMDFENFENTRSLSLSFEETQQIKKEDDSDKDTLQRFATEKQDENNRELFGQKRLSLTEKENGSSGFLEAEAIEKKSINWRSQSHMFCGTQRAASLVSGTCKINDEKKSDVNGSVIVSFLHETPIFLDSLESLSSLSPDAKNLGDYEGLRPQNDARTESRGKIKIADNVSKSCFTPKKKFKLCKKREFSSCENLTRSNFPKMLHRSRPDLIKGISGRSKEGLPSSSQSCTDVSNLSQSNSENSLNSSGSADVQHSEAKNIKKARSVDTKSAEQLPQKSTAKEEGFSTGLRKVDKRSEIVDAVTSRLYITKKKPDQRLKALQTIEKDHGDDDGELEELKLCKRARMKLFDLSRKLAMTRKFKKTVESDSQTDFCDRTVRVKEKSVITDRRGVPSLENSSTNTCQDEDLKPKSTGKVIMNQVFLPPQSKYFVIECGQGVRIEMPAVLKKNDLSIQTSPEREKTHKDVNTSPVKFIVCAEDSFSDDSLDLEEKGKINSEVLLESDAAIDSKLNTVENMDSASNSSIQRSNSSQGNRKILIHQKNSLKENHFPEGFHEGVAVGNESLSPKSVAEESKEEIVNNPLSIFSNNGELNCLTSLSLPLRKDENLSSENSFTSGDSTDAGSISETSSEDFVFYTGSKDQCRGRIPSDRELYTITENSEQSDFSDVFNPSQNECSVKNILETGESFSKSINNNLNVAFDRSGNKTWRSLDNPLVNKEGGSNYQVFAQNIQGNAQIGSFKKIPSKVDILKYKKNLEERSASPEIVPNLNSDFSKAFVNTPAKIQPDFNHKDVKSQSISSRFKKTNWSDLPMNPQKQYLNFNILNSSKHSQFVVDTHLLKDFSKKDQSTETVFTSEDSITFVFMGPAKPKTSVLMEVIKRSLNRQNSKETSIPQRAVNKGVQCNSKLIRSISVDTALTALSRIAKQHPFDIPRAISLDTLAQEEISAAIEQGRLNGFKEVKCHCLGSRCECHADSRHFKREPLKYSVSTATTRDQHTETENRGVDLAFEKSNSECSWCEKNVNENDVKCFDKFKRTAVTNSEDMKDSNLFVSCSNGSNEIDSSENQSFRTSSSDNFSNAQSNSQTRRVRFSKPETRSLEDLSEIMNKDKDFSKSNVAFDTFLKEATSLLKNLNYYSAQQKIFSTEIFKRLKDLQVEQSKGRRKETFRVSSKRFPKNLPPSDSAAKSMFSNSVKSCELQKENLQNLTWPRRRSAMSKPPKPVRYTPSPKPSRSPLSSIYNSFHSNSYLESGRNNSQSGRTISGSTIWNASNLSTTFSNSYVGQDQSGPSSLRSIYSNRSSSSPPVSFSKQMIPEENSQSLLDIRAELEESCRSLKIAAEQDKLRQETFESKMSVEKWTNRIVGKTYVEIENVEKEDSESELELEKNKLVLTKEVMKRRRTNECAHGCNCRSHKKSCTCFISKAFRSTFELDTFGPGSKHCLRFCMFCREKDSELYCSSPTLNSQCHIGLCRLNYYGYCPCSPVKLPYVSYSPRAYMQHLLTLRRRIVDASKSNDC